MTDVPPDDCEDCEGLERRVTSLERRDRRAELVSAVIGALLALAQHLL